MTGEPLVVIGMGQDGPAGLARDALDHIERAEVLAGGRRHLEQFSEWSGDRIVIEGCLDDVVRHLQASYPRHKTVVLASGDPLYFGIGRVLLDAIPRGDLVFLTHVSSIQLAFAAIKETWHDARVVSLHGRPMRSLLPALEEGAAKIALFTDATNDPPAIGACLTANGCGEAYAIWVCENLGGPLQRVTSWTPASIAGQAFAPLNVVVLLRIPPDHGGMAKDVPLVGIPESALLHRAVQRGLITKREVRLIAICYLELHAGDVLWDVGAGSGSVAIEAARLAPSLRVFAIERDPQALRQIHENVRNFGIDGLQVIAGEAPESMTDLPDPDAVFIGGSGGRLLDLIAVVVKRLRPGGRIVISSITVENFARGWEGLGQHGLSPQATSVQLAHTRPLGTLHRLEPESPISILWARKP